METKCGVWQIITIICVQYQLFTKLPQISHTHKHLDLKSIRERERPIAPTLQILWQGHVKNLLFPFRHFWKNKRFKYRFDININLRCLEM